MKKYIYLSLIALAGLTTSCRKHNSDSTATAIDLAKDSVYLYAKEDYLWYDALPSQDSFNPRGFIGYDDLTNLQNEVDAISQYKINPATNKPYEYSVNYPGTAKYSFIDQGQVASALAGNAQDFGFSVFYNTYNDLRIKYAKPGSPAEAAGLVRGYKVTAINGSTALAYNPNAADPNSDPNLLAVVKALSASSITLTLQKPDNSTFTVTVTAGSYTTNPILKSTVVDLGSGKKVGYIAFSTFTSPANATAKLDAAFATFATQGVTDLVVDLRYNGGGYVETAEYLDNLIVPAAKSGTKMYSAFYNTKLQNGQYPMLSNIFQINPGEFTVANNTVLFSKKGSLNINRVFFIVTGSTASASELTINNLIPEMDVKLIGTTSYGKPVGFFDIPIEGYELYIPEFETKNSADQGGYYTGMQPGSAAYQGVYDYDDVTHDFGDVNETLFAHALNYVSKGTYAIDNARVQSVGSGANKLSASQISILTEILDRKQFKGMLFNDRNKMRRRR